MQFSYKSVLTAAVVFAQGVWSFGDTSPHVFFSSTKELDNGLKKAQFASFVMDSAEFNRVIGTALSDCPSDAYIFVNQPALHTNDLTGSSTSSLRHFYDSATSKYIFPHVSNSDSNDANIPSASLDSLAKEITTKCNAKVINIDTSASSFEAYIDTTPRVISLDLPTLPDRKDGDARVAALEQFDKLLANIVHQLPSNNYVLVLTSSPVSAASNQPNPVIDNIAKVEKVKKHSVASAAPESEESVSNMLFENEDKLESEARELEKKVAEQKEPEPSMQPSSTKSTTTATASSTSGSHSTGIPDDELFSKHDGVFERYQFFSPGIFESTVISLLLVGIFFTSYSWISSLQITYKAFEKTPEIGGPSKAQ